MLELVITSTTPAMIRMPPVPGHGCQRIDVEVELPEALGQLGRRTGGTPPIGGVGVPVVRGGEPHDQREGEQPAEVEARLVPCRAQEEQGRGEQQEQRDLDHRHADRAAADEPAPRVHAEAREPGDAPRSSSTGSGVEYGAGAPGARAVAGVPEPRGGGEEAPCRPPSVTAAHRATRRREAHLRWRPVGAENGAVHPLGIKQSTPYVLVRRLVPRSREPVEPCPRGLSPSRVVDGH